MEANNIRDIMEAYSSIYSQPEEVGEVLSEEVIEEKRIAHGTGKKVMPSKKERSKLAKRARSGEDIGHKGAGFKKVQKKAAKLYGSEEAGKRVAAAAMFRQQAHKEEFETWVNDLVEEGHDLSEYSWDDMYEMFVNLDERKIDKDEKLKSGLTPRQKMDRKMRQHGARVMLGEPAFGRKSRNDPYKDSYRERGHTINTVMKAQDKGEEPRETSEFKNTIASRRRPRASYEVPNERPGGLRAKETKAGGHRTLKRKSDQNESYDLFDYLLEYLVAEGYADTNKNAIVIMANMSEEWKQSIIEEFPNVLNFPRQGGSRSGDAGTRGLTKTPTGYVNRHSRGEDLPPDTVNKIMGGHLMVKNQKPKSNTQTA